MKTSKKKTGRSIEKAVALATPHHLCNKDDWYSKAGIMAKLEKVNPYYVISDQVFYYWLRKLYTGTLKKIGTTTLYQGAFINVVLDTLIAFKSNQKGNNSGRK